MTTARDMYCLGYQLYLEHGSAGHGQEGAASGGVLEVDRQQLALVERDLASHIRGVVEVGQAAHEATVLHGEHRKGEKEQ